MKIRAVIFDLGYTLWDVDYAAEPEAYGQASRFLANALGGPAPDARKLRDAVAAVFAREMEAWLGGNLEQKPTDEIYREAFADLGLNIPDHLLQQMDELALSPSIRYTVDPQTPAVLRALRERGLRLGAVSNTYQSQAALAKSLAAHGLLEYLDALVLSSEIGLEKPHPAIFLEALRRLGVTAVKTVFVGDSVWADVLGAQALGMKSVLTHQYRREDPGEHKPDLVIERLAEVVDFVDRLNREEG
ncbi:MAG: HAD family hydrolase [Dehalococcoidia bacterium]|jgi:putative hydrolase of the HAD superfamily